MTCKTVVVHGKKKQQCRTQLVSGVVKFTTAEARATLSRHGVVFATGARAPISRGGYRLVLNAPRKLRAGRYTLTLRIRHGKRWLTQHSAITIM